MTTQRTIGLLGGMSWESTVPYYQQINQTVRARLGGLHSARILLHSVDFQEIASLQSQGDWDEAGRRLAAIARQLEQGGADLLVLCTNTMHKVADAITAAVQIPLLHIADPTASAIKAAGMSQIGLLGTRFTMEQDFYRARLALHGITALVPEAEDRDTVHDIIYQELCQGQIKPASRETYLRIIDKLAAQGAQGIILGCTEIGLLIGPQDIELPLFDTTRLHAVAAAEKALE
ncbi:aspartate/glutamate racemase family protein [Chitinimonas arctica]|uniref:Aspartate/glutamate racemase family protein n=1 Tax=Chitinimonas arctica TaxID=2594795 RepID=A0A516SLS9_9NEIS|nr:aspartate/glutamate racemase family protein [Chitinimonas arctica]QDQ28988.1 aspartate/glutamate racemase family protein [Chitinimonas arctica]